MSFIIDGIDFHNVEPMKYWQPPASWSNQKRKDEVRNRIFSGNWLGARKRDGAFYKFTKSMTGEMELTGRSVGVAGDYLDKIDWVPQLHPFFDSLPNGTCLLGEIVYPDNEGSKVTTSIMGCLVTKAIERQKTNPIHYYVFDCLAWDGESFINHHAEERFAKVMELGTAHYACVDFAEYWTGAELWDNLQDILATGGEGIVITKSDAVYEPGKRPSKTTMKVKQELKQTIDCVIIGANAPTVSYTGKEPENWQFWQDINTGAKLLGDHYKQYYLGEPIQPITKAYYYGWAGSLRIGLYKDGEMVYFGDVSGITDEVKEHWKDYVGKVCEIGGMQLFQDGEHIAVRHPRLLSWRADKPASECTWDQLNQ